VERTADGQSLQSITAALVAAIDPDRLEAAGGKASEMIAEACRPLAANPGLRQLIVEIKKSKEQTIDTVSQDEVLEAGFSAAATERAKALVTGFEQFVKEHRDEITALQVLYAKPYGQRLRFEDIRALADAIQAPPRQWTPEQLWQAYETLFASRVRGAPAKVLTNLVSLVRFALEHDALVPFPDLVSERFEGWVAKQEQHGMRFTPEQRQWLDAIRDHIAANLEITTEDLDYAPFVQRGGLGAAHRVFGERLRPLLDELTGVLAA
jgi:type I restriction enzyme, R subunit